MEAHFPNCENPVRYEDSVCPNCGHPHPPASSVPTWVIIVVVPVLVAMYSAYWR